MTPGGLDNRTIVVTRDPEQAVSTIAEIEKRGGTTVLFPTIRIVPVQDRAEAENAVANINRYDWMVFTSTNTIECFGELSALPASDSPGWKVAAIGDKTAAALKNRGIGVDLVPEVFSAAGLLDAFGGLGVEGKRFLQPCSRIARRELPDGLRELGAFVDQVVVYDTVPNNNLDADMIRTGIGRGTIDCLTFFSPSAFVYFADIVGSDTVTLLKDRGTPVAVIGPTTARAVRDSGIANIILPQTGNEKNLVEEIAAFLGEKN
jgi:uroporphyrinogen-III synthase